MNTNEIELADSLKHGAAMLMETMNQAERELFDSFLGLVAGALQAKDNEIAALKARMSDRRT
ncbi:hypothetical protein ACFIQG_09680 [Comamonas odontotermitis]|uniref:hypothetical protein n=1 Tax=Comamonas odontotermitis TaxID=379895 RepID=UPI00366F8726